MGTWLPAEIDIPRPLGEHLAELRRCLIWPSVAFGCAFVLGFAWHDRLKIFMVQPLRQAIALVGPDTARQLDLPTGDTNALLVARELAESAVTAATLSLWFALAVAAPVLLWFLWRFIALGLNARERRLAFLFVPGAALFFYGGVALGYFLALPWFYAWLFRFAAGDPTIQGFVITQSEYLSAFIDWTLVFGVILDVPWAVLVLVRVGLVTPDQLARARRWVALINVIAAACLTPGSDLASLIALFLPMQLLFEAGLLASRLFLPKKQP